jgi:hypothetical protein
MKKCPTGYTIEAHEIGLCNCQQANRQLADAGLVPLQEGETFCAEHCWVGTADNPCDACNGEPMSDKLPAICHNCGRESEFGIICCECKEWFCADCYDAARSATNLGDGCRCHPRRLQRPDWFKATTGFRYYDSDGDLCVVLGEGGYSRPKPLGNLELHDDGKRQGYSIYTIEFVPPGLIVAVLYKKDWVIFDLNKSEIEYSSSTPANDYWSGSKPYDTEAVK